MLGSLGAGSVPPGTPPVWACAADAPTSISVALHASPAIARVVRLLVNLPLSLLTGLADGLALKDRATRQRSRFAPTMGPPLSILPWMETQRKCARHISKG